MIDTCEEPAAKERHLYRRIVSGSNGGVGLNRSTAAIDGSSVIRGGRDAVQIIIPASTVSVTAQYLSFTVLVLMFFCMCIQVYCYSDLISHARQQSTFLQYIIKMKQQERDGNAPSSSQLDINEKYSLPTFSPTDTDNLQE